MIKAARIAQPSMWPGGNQHHQHGGHYQLVGDGIEEAAEARDLVQAPRHITVEPIGDAGEHEQDQCDPMPEGARKNRKPTISGNRGDPRHGEKVGEIQHCWEIRLRSSATIAGRAHTVTTPNAACWPCALGMNRLWGMAILYKSVERSRLINAKLPP
jgi:hypothetical protein